MPYVTEQNLTDVALERWKDIPDPRLRQIMQSLIKHLHGFVRDIEPTEAEWAVAIDWLTRTGQMCSQKRQEFILTSDVLGVSMLVDAINHRRPSGATPTTVEGPFHVPERAADRRRRRHGGGRAGHSVLRHRHGAQTSTASRSRGAVLDLWQTDGEGLYEDQRESPRALYARRSIARSRTAPTSIRTVAPIGYTIPMDGTVGELMNRTNISHMRPAHIHFASRRRAITAASRTCSRRGDEYIETDVVYGVKEPLIVEFVQEARPARRRTARWSRRRSTR